MHVQRRNMYIIRFVANIEHRISLSTSVCCQKFEIWFSFYLEFMKLFHKSKILSSLERKK